MGRETHSSAVALRFIDKMLTLLAEQRLTREQMQVPLFASKSKMLRYIQFLHGDTGAEKRIYVWKYLDTANGGQVPCYAAGNKPDAKPRGTRTAPERWEHIKADPVRHAAYLARLRKYARKRGAPSRTKAASPFAALGL